MKTNSVPFVFVSFRREDILQRKLTALMTTSTIDRIWDCTSTTVRGRMAASISATTLHHSYQRFVVRYHLAITKMLICTVFELKNCFAGQKEPNICVSLAVGTYVVSAVAGRRYILHPFLIQFLPNSYLTPTLTMFCMVHD